ncbi:hypothetical protein [Deinococcus sp. QL22]|uniref:hypothetical protein n=1 Tax=Deinococcus sp. QL22 TaxID=2939437 RepID=UPI0020172321|nr:hypothetical protein [Deinococcus sp. QL22]UQN08994.1 hypothetical protein M1R55_20625 [Deinococcus sp. QL22]
MPLFPLANTAQEEALSSLAQGKRQAMQTCIQVFAPLLFTLAERAQVTDQEAAVAAVLQKLQLHHQGWRRSGLSAQVWVTGMAQRHFHIWERSQLGTDGLF